MIKTADPTFFNKLLFWLTSDAVHSDRRSLSQMLFALNIYLMYASISQYIKTIRQSRRVRRIICVVHLVGYMQIYFGGAFFPSIMLHFAYLDYVRSAVLEGIEVCETVGRWYVYECQIIDQFSQNLDYSTNYPYFHLGLIAFILLLLGFACLRVRLSKLYAYVAIDPSVSSSPCVICHDDLSEETTVSLPCFRTHSFHKKCIDSWLDGPGNGTCPICRTVVPTN